MRKLVASGLLLSNLFLTCLATVQQASVGPPKVSGSFRAMGEIVESMPDSGNIILQMMYEENFDVETGDAEFVVWELGKTVMYVENKKTDQTFRIVDGQCDAVTQEEWVETDAPPSLSKYTSSDGKVRFSLRQLFSLDDKYLKETEERAEVRGIPALKWMYEFKGKENGSDVTIAVYTYWSDPKSNWNLTSSASKGSIPLAYAIDKIVLDEGKKILKTQEQHISVNAFYVDSVDKNVFMARQGIICPNVKSSYPFPKIDNFRAVSFHSEIVLPDYQQIKTVDGWYDTTNKLLRLDMDRIKDEDMNTQKFGRKYSSEMVSGVLGAVFRVTWFRGKGSCNVSSLVNYDFDIQDLVNPKLDKWSLQKTFGLNDTNYVHIGKSIKRGIPCHVFQGIRKDWPETSAGVSSLWEWCLAVHLDDSDEDVTFRDNELPLVNAEITILETKDKTKYPVGFKLIHHFYDVKVEDPKVMDAINFDIRYCFDRDSRRELQFSTNVAITDDNKDAIENATSDVYFLQTWKAEIALKAGLKLESLRISKVESTVSDKKLFVRFMLLGVHPDLPESARKDQKSLSEAEKSLKEAIDKEAVQVKYKPTKDAQELVLTATKGSLTEQINRTLINVLPSIVPPTSPPTTTKSSGISIVTEPEVSTKSTGSTVTSPTDSSKSSGQSTVTSPTDSSKSSGQSTVTSPTDSSKSSGQSTVTSPTDSSKSSGQSTVTSPTDSSKSSGQSTVTDPGDSTGSSGQSTVTNSPGVSSTKSTKVTVKLTGHQPGAVAATTIIMLILGITIGSSGTFVKYNGLPLCLRNRWYGSV